MHHSNSGAVASIPRIVGRDHVCVARNKTNILRNKIMLDDDLKSITTFPQKRMRNTLNFTFISIWSLNLEHPYFRQFRLNQWLWMNWLKSLQMNAVFQNLSQSLKDRISSIQCLCYIDYETFKHISADSVDRLVRWFLIKDLNFCCKNMLIREVIGEAW